MGENSFIADVAVVGAGPAGSTVAGLLARGGWDVVLADRANFPREKTCGDGLTPRAVLALQRLGVLSDLEKAGFLTISGARLVSPTGEMWHLRFGEHDFGLPPYGLVVPRHELDARLLAHALADGVRFLPEVNIREPLRAAPAGPVTGVVGDRRGQRVIIQARVTVLAVGAHIGLLRAFGLLARMPPGINAVRGYFAGVADLEPEFEFYFEHALLPGYAWVFPLADGHANVGLGVFGRDGNSRSPNLRRLLSDFMARWPRLRDARLVAPLKGFPLRIDFPSQPAVGEGFLLAGEALGLVNPVTGEGIDLALESGEMAARAVDAALRMGDGLQQGLQMYGRALDRRYGSFFRGARLLLRLAMRPRGLTMLIAKGKRKPYLARLIAGINMGMASPWLAFAPRTWWEILT
ncbi:MAG: NAD(P)/FAD-dependent oxidoreductase [Anaerolineae bacterium]